MAKARLMSYTLRYIVFAGLLFASCKKDTPRNDGDQNGPLVGKWQWVLQTDAKAIFGIPYDTLTPQNTGITEFLNLDTDGSWTLVQNDQTINSGTYKFLTIASPDGLLTSLDLANHGKDSTINHTLSNDSLYTSNMLYTGKYTVRIYVRQGGASAPADQVFSPSDPR